MLVSKPVSLPYVDNTEEEVTNMCHSFEVDKPEVAEGSASRRAVNQVVAGMMTKNGYEEGKGLGRHLQGVCTPVLVKQKSDTYGIDCEGYLETKLKALKLGEEKAQEFPHLSDTFPTPAEVISLEDIVGTPHRLVINMVDQEDPGACGVILLNNNQGSLSNRQAEPVVDVVTLM